MRRLFVLLVVAVGLAPGTWWRSPPPPDDRRQGLTVTALAVPRADLGPLELVGAWLLDSPNRDFGSYSGLAVLAPGELLAASDNGGMMAFSAPGEGRAHARIGDFTGNGGRSKRNLDIEALARDPATGTIWVAFEMTNRIERYDAHFRRTGRVWPEAMAGWSANAGPEAMARLADGRFVVLAEASPGWFDAETPGLLFAGDPVAGAEPRAFRFRPPEGFRPVDMAPLPDGRVVILLRQIAWGLPPGFAGRLVLADPAEIEQGKPWRAKPLAVLAPPLPSDNYEGLAIEPDGRGGAVLWLISDDNGSAFQRTLLLRLVWRANEKARGD